MSRIRQIRESADAKLDKLDAHADALEVTLHHAEDQILGRIDRGKQEVHRALDTLKADIDKSKHLSEAYKHKLQGRIDELKVQIALGKAEARDAHATAHRRLHGAARMLEAELDAALAEVKGGRAEFLDASIYVYVRATDKLDADLDAAEARFSSAREKADAAFDKRREEMSQKIATFKRQLGERTHHTREKLATFEGEARTGFEQIAKAFKDLFA